MSWLKDFLGLKKVKTPTPPDPEEVASMDAFESEAYLKAEYNKFGFEDTIKAKKSKLAGRNFLSAGSYTP